MARPREFERGTCMRGLLVQARATLLFRTEGDERVDDIVPGLQHGLVVIDGGFFLLRFT